MAYSFLELALDVLSKANKPLTYQEVWQSAEESGLTAKLGTVGKTPWQSLGAQLYVDVRDNDSSKFIKVGKRPARFFMKERSQEITEALFSKIENAEKKLVNTSPPYKERDLHPVLTYYASAYRTLNRGREVLTKTIYHENAKKSGYSEWTYPDMVGFSIPLEDWQTDVIAFNELSDKNALTLFSFELKREINKATYREAYFQAVSNSSWAHQGYLVAAKISQDDDLLAELERLAASFGIGIIQLQLSDLSESQVIYPARAKGNLDWETINKLCEENKDFQTFLQSVRIDVNARKLHRTEYDTVIKEIDAYLQEHFQGWSSSTKPQ
ncbi:MAG: hypothetical protein KF708_16290 [Pirellulales bacterium]|nr:hypothetical protein [Pirellulales bacterium]